MRKYLTEFIGTFFLVFTIGMAVRSGSPLAPLAIADRVALVMDGRIERIGPPTEILAYARIRMAEASRREGR